MKTVAGYGRVSTKGQVDGTSLEDQKKIIENYCKKENYNLVELYFDEGISGGSLDRPALLKLREDARDKKFEAVLYTKLDRMGRSVRDIFNLWHELKNDCGIDLICISDPSLNTDGKMGGIMLAILSSFAEFERVLIKERTQGGRRATWDKGQLPIGKQSLPLGYRKNEEGDIEIVPEHARVYQHIARLYLDERLSTKQIALRLTADHVPSPSALRGKKRQSTRWNSITVGDILKHSAYKGMAIFNQEVFEKKKGNKFMRATRKKPESEWIKVKFPPLIDEDRWQEIQDRIQNQRHKPKRVYKGYEDHFLLDGLLYCDVCGSRMKKVVKQEKSGKVRLYYSCFWQSCSQNELSIAGREKCSMRASDADQIDSQLFYQIINLLADPDKFAASWFVDMDTEDLQQKLTGLEKKDKQLLNQLKEGYRFISSQPTGVKDIYLEEHKKVQAEWEALQPELKKVRQEIDAIENKIDRYREFKEAMKEGTSRDKFKKRFKTEAEFFQFMDSLPFPEKRRIVDAVISPERGGKIKLAHVRPYDVMDADDLADLPVEDRHRPIIDRPPMVYAEFSMDLNRIEAAITSLNRDGLLNKTTVDSITRRQEYFTGRRWDVSERI